MFTARGAQMPYCQFGDKGTAFFRYTQYSSRSKTINPYPITPKKDGKTLSNNTRDHLHLLDSPLYC